MSKHSSPVTPMHEPFIADQRYYEATVTVTDVHPGALPRVKVDGPGTRIIRDAIMEILQRYSVPALHDSYAIQNTYAITEIDKIFGEPASVVSVSDCSALHIALDEAAERIARARKLLSSVKA